MPMRILFLITRGDSIGGAQIHVRDLAKRLHGEGHDVLVCFGEEGAFSSMLAAEGISFHPVPDLIWNIHPVRDMLALKNIVTEIKVFKPDILTVHSSKTGILGRIAAKITHTPVVFTVHGWSFTEGISPQKRMVYQGIEKIGAWLSDAIITVSEYDKKLALSKGVSTGSKTVTIHNGIPDIPNISLAQTEVEPPKIVMVARFQEPKDHSSLIRALHALQHLPWQLELAGEDGGLLGDVQQLVSDLGMEERIAFLGNRSDVPEILSQSQIFVLISKWEGFPLTVLEAMRSGLPVIASDVGGVNEAVVDKETGYLVSGQETLVSCLESLIRSPELRKQMGQNGLKRYKEYFTFNQMFAATFHVYSDVLSRNKTK